LRRILFGLALATACYAAAPALAAPPPAIDAHAWLVENPTTGAVLAQYDATAPVPIASITKLMTVLVALQHEKLGDVVTVDPRVTTVGQESIDLRPGEEMTVHDLVKGALIQSANDAADALALSVAPSFPAFAKLMNAKARALGLRDTHFVRPDGLDATGEYSSARDVTKLALAAMRVPVIRLTVGERQDVISGDRTLHTWNDLLGVVPGVIGVKTGHTSLAGWCQVTAFREPGLTLYATILGSPSRSQRDADLERLLRYGVDQYRVVSAIEAGRVYARVTLPYGKSPLPLVARTAQSDLVRLGRPLTERVLAPAGVSLPVHRGEELGRVEIWAGDRLLGSRSLVAARSVPRPSTASRIRWYAGRTVHHVLGLLK